MTPTLRQLAVLALITAAHAAEPPPYVPTKAFYILPETTSEESGYFSLGESLDGSIHVGSAKYGSNSFLVEFDPRTDQQCIVLDTNKTCGLTASGYAAQAKLHTRNFVGPSGKIYIGSKQGYPIEGDKQEYPGGAGYFHHLTRYDPAAKKHEDLGVLKVTNPDFFDFSPRADGKPPHHSHGFHTLPDGTLTVLHVHMALVATRDGTLYATTIYPFTLLKMDGYQLPSPAPSAAARYLDALARKLDEAAARIPEITKLAERVAERHDHGGLIGFPGLGSTLEQELLGRAGGLMHIGFDRPWKKERTAEEKTNDVVIYGWDAAPKPGDLQRVQADKAKGLFVIGFGPRTDAEIVAACEAWVDSGEEDPAIGKTHHLTNAVNGWLFIGEFVGALTRHGKMPAMWKAWIAADGHEWSDRYFGKVQFHDEFKVPPQPPGEIAGRYLARIRYLVARLKHEELADIRAFAADITTELSAGRKTTVASSGHMGMRWIARFSDSAWAVNHEVHHNVESQMKSFEK